MVKYIFLRLIAFFPVLLAILVLVFSILHLLPGDPVDVLLHGQGYAVSITPEQREALREALGLADPLHVQFIRYVRNVIRGDLGESVFSQQPVTKMIAEAVPYTLRLVTASMLFASLFGILLGLLAALRANSWIDTLCMLVSTLGISMPDFWLGLLLIFLFALRLGWLPAIGQGGIRHLVLPAVTLGIAAMSLIARVTRSSLLEVLQEGYITTARAKGLGEPIVLIRHVLRNAMIPIVTILSIQIGRFLAGSIVIETVFARQGVGRLLIQALLDKDYPLVQGTILFIATCVLAVNLAVDLLYVVIDPRVEYR